MKIKLICQYCKNDFFRIPSRSWSSKKGEYGKVHKKFCSSVCAHDYLVVFWNSPAERKARSIRAMGEKNGRWVGGLLKCIDCEEFLSVRQGALRCTKCNGKITSQTRIGKNHWNWQGGKTSLRDSVKNLYKSKCWRIAVFKRDNYTCQECGETKCYLEAHHRKEFVIIFNEFLKKYFQYSLIEDRETLVRLAMNYKDFWDVSNGITLCGKCHNKTKRSYNFKHNTMNK